MGDEPLILGEPDKLTPDMLNAVVRQHQQTKMDIMREALWFIADRSTCECYDSGGIGNPVRWVGCPTHHSSDPNEYCFSCKARAAIIASA